MNKGLFFIIAMVLGYALSWAVVVGIIKFITMCFSIGFSFPIATGVWLILCLLKLVFHNSEGRR